jgi:hypothetical protein
MPPRLPAGAARAHPVAARVLVQRRHEGLKQPTPLRRAQAVGHLVKHAAHCAATCGGKAPVAGCGSARGGGGCCTEAAPHRCTRAAAALVQSYSCLRQAFFAKVVRLFTQGAGRHPDTPLKLHLPMWVDASRSCNSHVFTRPPQHTSHVLPTPPPSPRWARLAVLVARPPAHKVLRHQQLLCHVARRHRAAVGLLEAAARVGDGRRRVGCVRRRGEVVAGRGRRARDCGWRERGQSMCCLMFKRNTRYAAPRQLRSHLAQQTRKAVGALQAACREPNLGDDMWFTGYQKGIHTVAWV